MGTTMNQFRRLCLSSAPPLGPIEGLQSTYSSINSLSTAEDNNRREKFSYDDAPTTDDDKDNSK